MWVLPCRFDPARPVIFECVEAIQRHHIDPQIVVVDSNSSDKSYLQWCLDHGCEVADINNVGFGLGAFGWAVKHHTEVDFFYLIFDSLIVQSNCDQFQCLPLTTIRHWHSSQHDWGWDEHGRHLSDWGGEQLDRMGIHRTDDYHGVFGPMMFVQRTVVDRLDNIGYWDVQVTSKYLQCAMERVTGITLEALGYDTTRSLQGTHTTHTGPYDETYVKKLDLARS